MLNKVLRLVGYQLEKKKREFDFPPDFSEKEKKIIEKVRPFTMTSSERLFSLIHAVEYTVSNQIPGAIVECGVWKGGSMMAIALTLLEKKVKDRELFLYDTFSGMPEAGALDKNFAGQDANELLEKEKNNLHASAVWAYSELDEVRSNIKSIGYPSDRIHYVQGKVEETIPNIIPDQIALLRLDTDWYESTKHELIHLFPRLQPNGILIIDDYGFWKGARKAVDEYLSSLNHKYYLHRIDETGRLLIKQN